MEIINSTSSVGWVDRGERVVDVELSEDQYSADSEGFL